MLSPDITLATKVYSLASQRTNSSVRRVATRGVSEPLSLTISHDTAKNGRVSSAIIFDDTKVVQVGASLPTADNIRVLCRIQYNPLSGRSDINTTITTLITSLIDLLDNSADVTKILNLES